MKCIIYMRWFKYLKIWKKLFVDVHSPTLSECTSIFFTVCLKINFIYSFIEFKNSDNCIRKITSKSFRTYPVFILKYN